MDRRPRPAIARDLRAVEGVAPSGIVASIFDDEKPLLGLPSLLDFRLAGRLGRYLKSGALTGRAGEQFLTPLGRRVSVPWLLLIGIGPRAHFDVHAAHLVCARMFDAIDGLGWSSAVMDPPGVAAGLIDGPTAGMLFASFGTRTSGVTLILPTVPPSHGLPNARGPARRSSPNHPAASTDGRPLRTGRSRP